MYQATMKSIATATGKAKHDNVKLAEHPLLEQEISIPAFTYKISRATLQKDTGKIFFNKMGFLATIIVGKDKNNNDITKELPVWVSVQDTILG